MPYIELPEKQIYYRQYGSGQPILFLHGLSFDSRMWQPQYEALQDDFLLLGMDFRGHGFSDAPDGEYSLETYVDDITTLLNALHLPRAILVGLSLGGAVAMEFALRFPGRCEALMLVSSALAGHHWSRAWKEMMERVHTARDVRTLKVRLREYWLRDPMFAGVRGKTEYGRMLQSMAETFSGKPILLGNFYCRDGSSASDRLQEFRCPVSVVSGSEDRTDFRRIARRLGSEVPRVEWHELDGVGHMVNLEAPEEFNSRLESFIYRVDAGGI